MTDSPDTIAARFAGSLGSFTLDVAFTAPMQGLTALFGASGSGKTTILRCIAGLARLPGRLSVGGEVWQDDRIFRFTHERPIGYVFQEASLFPHLSVRDNLRYGQRRAARAGAQPTISESDTVAFLGLDRMLERAPATLSGGERQRVAIGRALLSQARVLLMDEPLAALDLNSKEEILPYLEALHERLAIPMLYVSHDLSEVQRLADTIVLLEKGRVIATGPLSDVLTDVNLPSARRPDASAMLDAEVGEFDARYALTHVSVSGGNLLVPGRIGEPGSHRRVRVAAADVSLVAERPSATTISNVLPARIVEMRPLDDAQVNVVLQLGQDGAGARLLARVTRRSAEMLSLAPGQQVFAQVKAVSMLRRRAAAKTTPPVARRATAKSRGWLP
ncbi:MAG: molybdenum ABC transporter ATP-binding protein [Alphaproteobacteria bacterium]|nr:molybdenum ABC transporter ATP-binding protein [Alphaproteobacteria bacterium]